jgi:hypothetical protein
MLTFATEIPLDGSCNPGALSAIAEKWVLGSPYTSITEAEFREAGPPDSWEFDNGTEWFSSITVFEEGQMAFGFQYGKRDKGLEWVTSIVISQKNGRYWAGVRVAREAQGPAPRLPKARKPIVVGALLEGLPCADDGPLPILDRAYYLCEADVSLAKSLIQGDSGCYLPVVYMSSHFGGGHALDCNRLAEDLAGMAHVVVEPSRAFSSRLQIEVDSANIYGGGVGVYWPDSSGRRYRYFPENFQGPGDLAWQISMDVQKALTHRRPLHHCTWPALEEQRAKKKLRELRKRGSSQVEEYIAVFDEELRGKQSALDNAEQEIRRLMAEVHMYEATQSNLGGVEIASGNEKELYPGEFSGIIVDCLKEGRSNVSEDSRREHVLDSLLNVNPSSGRGDLHRDSLKELLKGYKKMNAKVRRGLEEMGFEISDDGKHYKMMFRGDDRYTFALPKSGSDRRGGRNAASTIGRLLF